MRIAVTSTGRTLDSPLDPRFGRATCFIIIDTETMDFETIENENVEAPGGAGISSAKRVADNNAEAVITGNCGPNAHRTLTAGGIKVYTCSAETVKEAVELFKAGKLTEAAESNVQSRFGMEG